MIELRAGEHYLIEEYEDGVFMCAILHRGHPFSGTSGETSGSKFMVGISNVVPAASWPLPEYLPKNWIIV